MAKVSWSTANFAVMSPGRQDFRKTGKNLPVKWAILDSNAIGSYNFDKASHQK